MYVCEKSPMALYEVQKLFSIVILKNYLCNKNLPITTDHFKTSYS
ncbi:unnamed protein product [Spodoptera exigua]|nr:unnamed protein product [Spodoptera exigua]